MDGKLTYGASLVMGVLALVLLIANVAMIDSNRHMQDNASQRQAEISKGTSLATLNQSLVQALAEAAINSNDTAVRDLLASQNITIKPGAAKASADAKPANVKKGG